MVKTSDLDPAMKGAIFIGIFFGVNYAWTKFVKWAAGEQQEKWCGHFNQRPR